jgi:glycerophosphoryl diester phosphodiesterase
MRDIEWLKHSFIAHRGSHSFDFTIPENSMKAFQISIERGFAIEFDVNLMGDGTLVVFHDKDLKRMTGIDAKLLDLRFDQIKKYRLLDTQETIPTLTKVLDLVKGKVPLLIELKNHGQNETLCKNFMETMKHYQGVWAVQSFHPFTMKWFRTHHPHVIRGQISEYFLQDNDLKPLTKWLLKRMVFNFLVQPDFINYGIKYMPNRYVDHAKKMGTIVIGYCARTPQEYAFCKHYIDNAVFEFFDPTVKCE